MGRADFILETLLLGFVLSVSAFAFAALFKPNSLIQSGRIELNTSPPFIYSVRFAIPYTRPPHLLITRHNHIQKHWVIFEDRDGKQQSYQDNHQAFNAAVTEESEVGFSIAIEPNLVPDRPFEEVASIPIDAYLNWRAEGAVDADKDSRSPWIKLSPPQRVFSVSGVLFALGIVADFAGIYGLFTK